MNLYKALWSRIGKRPWTYILRDTWHKLEGIWIICLVAVGSTLCHFFSLKITLIGLGIFCVGYIFGHLFWGTSWKEGQKGG